MCKGMELLLHALAQQPLCVQLHVLQRIKLFGGGGEGSLGFRHIQTRQVRNASALCPSYNLVRAHGCTKHLAFTLSFRPQNWLQPGLQDGPGRNAGQSFRAASMGGMLTCRQTDPFLIPCPFPRPFPFPWSPSLHLVPFPIPFHCSDHAQGRSPFFLSLLHSCKSAPMAHAPPHLRPHLPAPCCQQ